MNLFDIVIGICLMSDPSQCREQRIEYESYDALNQCILDAQFYIASWQSANPGYTLKSWRCEYAKDQGDDDETQTN